MHSGSWILLLPIAPTAIAAAYLPFNSPLEPSSEFSQKRLWSAIFASLLILAVWAVWALYIPGTGWDFPGFYTAGNLPLRSLYDPSSIRNFGEHTLRPLGIWYFPPYVRPAIFATALRWMQLTSYWHAFIAWASLNLFAYAACVFLLHRWLKLPSGLLPGFAAFTPAFSAIISGQDSPLVLLMMICGTFLVLRGRNMWGGILLGLCCYKFNLVVLIPVALLLHANWMAFAAFAGTATIAAGLSVMLVPFQDYVNFVLRISPQMAINVTYGGLRGLAIQLHHPGLYAPIALVGVGICIYFMMRLPLRESICVGIAATLLFTYQTANYDCTLLALPMAVLWKQTGPSSRLILLLLLHVVLLWLLGEAFTQVFAEVAIIASFARLSLKPAPLPVSANAA